ncbi:MAG: hypothetical protein U0M13_11820, partial [Desulfovibrio fairfieldensis]|nr:hypothetical protein [Desulfovibrio fairfieldensis]
MPIANESFVANFIFPHPLLENTRKHDCELPLPEKKQRAIPHGVWNSPLLWKISRKDGSLGYSLSL